jgi:hypothetical protein
LFAADATVDDNGHLHRGAAAIKAWSERDIFAAKVTLAVVATLDKPGEIVVTAIVDGDFDRTGLPEPLMIAHHLQTADGKIRKLTCRLMAEMPVG